MAANRLALYNIALAALGQRTLDSTSEHREIRRALDKVYDAGAGAVDFFLEQGLWDFAMARSSITASTTAPSFGFANQFPLPSDFVRLAQVSADVDFADPIIRYEIEGTNLLAEGSALYLRYVSNSTTLGGDLANWPDTFTRWAGYWLATQVAIGFSESAGIETLEARTDRMLVNARQKDASQAAQPWPPRAFDRIEHREQDYPLELLTRHDIRRER